MYIRLIGLLILLRFIHRCVYECFLSNAVVSDVLFLPVNGHLRKHITFLPINDRTRETHQIRCHVIRLLNLRVSHSTSLPLDSHQQLHGWSHDNERGKESTPSSLHARENPIGIWEGGVKILFSCHFLRGATDVSILNPPATVTRQAARWIITCFSFISFFCRVT